MNKKIIKEYTKEGFKIVVDGKIVKIETIDYHPLTLILDKNALSELGLCFKKSNKKKPVQQ